ncbi:MAG: hypothetical protein WBQ94_25490 [Terracidiphilus sp.]
MKHWLPVLFLLAGLGSSFSISQNSNSSAGQRSPLDFYIEGLRTHSMNNAAAGFTQICGVKLDEAAIRFAFSNDDSGTWKLVDDLPKAYGDIEMDLVGTAEVSKNPTGTVVEIWQAALDVGGFSRSLFCFDKDGRLTVFDATNFQVPTDDGKPWGMHERWILKKDGAFQAAIPCQFIDLDEKVIPKPKLDQDDEKFTRSWGHRPPPIKTLNELKLPKALFN